MLRIAGTKVPVQHHENIRNSNKTGRLILVSREILVLFHLVIGFLDAQVKYV